MYTPALPFTPTLMTMDDVTTIQALLLPTMDAEDIQTALSQAAILTAPIGGRAEAIVTQRLGADWPLFAAANEGATLPTYYAQGNSPLAHQLCHDALIAFSCAQLIAVGVLQQVIATSTQIDGVQLTFALDWDKRRAEFERQGYAALDLLRRPFPVPHRRFLTPTGGAVGEMRQTIQPGTGAGPRWGWHRGVRCDDDRW